MNIYLKLSQRRSKQILWFLIYSGKIFLKNLTKTRRNNNFFTMHFQVTKSHTLSAVLIVRSTQCPRQWLEDACPGPYSWQVRPVLFIYCEKDCLIHFFGWKCTWKKNLYIEKKVYNTTRKTNKIPKQKKEQTKYKK